MYLPLIVMEPIFTWDQAELVMNRLIICAIIIAVGVALNGWFRRKGS